MGDTKKAPPIVHLAPTLPVAEGEEAAGTPPGLRALTVLGCALLFVALLLFTIPWQVPHNTDIGDAPLRALSATEVVVATALACTGVVVLAVRVAAGVLLRELRARG